MSPATGYREPGGKTGQIWPPSRSCSWPRYEPFDLPARAVDVALVPYWFLLDTDGRRLVERHLRGRHVVAVHIPPGELDDVAERLRQEMPDVVVFRRASETRRFKAP